MQAELSRTIREHVNREIDASLRDARFALEAYLDVNSEGTELSQCVNLIEQVDGAISILNHQSLSTLSQALLELAMKLKSDGVEYPELALELLIKGMGVIPNYLYLLESGTDEYENFFIPLVNDINQLLGKKFIFDDYSDFKVDLSASANDEQTSSEIDAEFFQAKRPEFLKALLGLYKSSDLNAKDLFPLINVLDEFAEKTAGSVVGDYFLIARNLLENIKGQNEDSIRTSKILLGRIDKLVKHLVDPASSLSQDDLEEFGKRLFSQLISIDKVSPDIQSIKEKYNISNDLQPQLDRLEMYRDFVSGPNSESYEIIAHTIYQEIEEIRESVELYLVERDISRFAEIREPINQLGNIIKILGFADKGNQLHELLTKIDATIESGGQVAAELLDEVAFQIVDLERYIAQLAYLRTVDVSNLYERIQVFEEKHLYNDLSKLIYDTVSKISSQLLELKKTKVLTDQVDIILEYLVEVRGVYKFFFSDKFDYVFTTCIEFITDKKNKQASLEDFKVFALLLADLEGLFDSYIQHYEIDEELSQKIKSASEEVAAATIGLEDFLGMELNSEDEAMDDFVSELAKSADDSIQTNNADNTAAGSDGDDFAPFTDDEFESLLNALDDNEHESKENLDSIEYFLEESRTAIQVIKHLTPRWLENIADNELLNEIIASFTSIKNSSKLANANEISKLTGLLEKLLLDLQRQNLGYSLAIGDILMESESLISDYINEYKNSDVSHFHDQIIELCDAVEMILSIDRSDRQSRGTEELVAPKSKQRALEPELHEIYDKETQTHLQTIARVIERCQSEPDKCLVTDELIRALHTMHGSSHMANVHDVADVTGVLEEKFVELQNMGFSLNDGAISLLSEFSAAVQKLLPELMQDGATLEDKKDLISRAEQLVYDAQAEESVLEDVFFDFDRPDELAEIFLEEAEEILGKIDASLTQWADDGEDKVHIHEIERALHTLKGGSRMASISILADISHAVESKLKNYLDDGSGNPSELNRIVQRSQEQLIRIVDAVKKGSGLNVDGQLLADLDLYPDDALSPVSDDKDHSGDDAAQLLDLDSDLDIDLDLGDEIQLEEQEDSDALIDLDMDLAAETPQTDVQAEAAEYSRAERDATESEQTPANDILEGGPEQPEDIERALENTVKQGVDQVRVRSDILDDLIKQASETNIVNSNLEQHFSGFKQNLEELNGTVERLRNQLRQLEIETESQIVYRMDGSSGSVANDFDPLEFDRFTQLQTLSRSMLESLSDLESIESAINNEISSSEKTLTQQTRVSQDLQDGLLRTRMTPFSSVLPRLTRIVNQTADELNKQVDFQISGETNEVDGTLLAKIISPIEHILRNAVYHGIERSEIREARGKNPEGRVQLKLAYERSELIITISDDGAGLNTDAIKSKAVQLGMIPDESVISDEDAAQLILQSGLSTAEELTQISGRGVGMDVVNTEVKNVGGTLHIATKRNNGTTFTLHLPTKLSLLQALIVEEESNFYAIPIVGIEGVENIRGEKLQTAMTVNSNTMEWYNETYRLVSLSELLGYSKDAIFTRDEKYPVIFASFGEHKVAVFIDNYLGNKEIVTKPLGPQLDSIRGLMGGAIMADGTVALILDLSSLARPGLKSVLQKYSTKTTLEDRKLVLIVDDSITVRRISEKFLTANQYAVLKAKDGIDALAVLEEHTPDIILLDIEMPRMNGYDLLQHIRQDERLKHLPIIMITSRTGEKHKQKALELGANAYFGKPYNEAELLSQIESLI